MTTFYEFSFPTVGGIKIDYIDHINYAMYHNNYKTLSCLVIQNDSLTKWWDISITISGEMLKTSQLNIDFINGMQSVDISKELEIEIDPQVLTSYTEGLKTTFNLRIECGNTLALDENFTIYIMPFTHWSGISCIPESLGSFVLPNHPCITSIISKAKNKYENYPGFIGFNGYNEGPTYAKFQVNAIWQTLLEENITFSIYPAHFEELGQRIRLVDEVLTSKIGNSIELTLLLASCLEAIGLYPILVLMPQHCLLGVWLDGETYTDKIGYSSTYLTNNATEGLPKLLLIESTYLTKNHSLESAIKMAYDEVQANDIECFIDVTVARLCGTKPLPQRIKDGDKWVVAIPPKATAPTDVIDVVQTDLTPYEKGVEKNDKITLWERKLLDLSFNNKLLKCRFKDSISIPIISTHIELYERLLSNMPTTLKLLPSPFQEISDVFNQTKWPLSPNDDDSKLIDNQLLSNVLYSFLELQNLLTNLKNLYRQARECMEENGSNNLFLALGFLEWQKPNSNDFALAPILLVPTELDHNNKRIKILGDETMINQTLIEALKKYYNIDLSSLEELPRTNEGTIDIKTIIAVISDKIKDQPHWRIQHFAILTLFSFSKYVMWNDIHSNVEKLRENPIIESLIEGELKYSENINDIDAQKEDKELSPNDLLLPLDVDSSQLEAIIASEQGKSFILHGPPGTGKSQTITNIIANALYHGKKVLFVSEKMAALQVVEQRLNNIGLDPFCLELHSNKAVKRYFLTQLDKALNVKHYKSQQEFELEAEQLYQKRLELIGYIDALHQKQPNGLSLYECIDAYGRISTDTIKLNGLEITALNERKINEIAQLLQGLHTIFKISGNPSNHPLNGLDILDGTAKAEDCIVEQLTKLNASLERYLPLSKEFSQLWGFDIIEKKEFFEIINKYVTSLSILPLLTKSIAHLIFTPAKTAELKNALLIGKELTERKAALKQRFTQQTLQLKSADLELNWDLINSKWWLAKLVSKKKYLKQLSYTTGIITEQEVPELIKSLAVIEELTKKYESSSHDLCQLFVPYTKAEKEDWRSIEVVLNSLDQINESCQEYAQLLNISKESAFNLLSNIIRQDWSLTISQATSLNSQIINSIGGIFDALEQIKPFAKITIPNWNELKEKLPIWLENQHRIKDFYLWTKQKHILEEEKLQCVVNYILTNPSCTDIIADIFKKSAYQEIAYNIIRNNETLRQFNSLLFEDVIVQYRRLTSRFKQYSTNELIARLAANVPSQTIDEKGKSEVVLLRRFISNGGRGTSIRKLIEQIPNLLPLLTPCMLMSPLSVAQFIDIDHYNFDLVIFDEASQIPTCETIGAIARGKSLIVVGDPKQLPPTSFFETKVVGQEDIVYDDLESILNDCTAISLPAKSLQWHYRSKHESLISFSNSQYYDGELITFPSADDQISKVTLRLVDGVYDKGRTRSNKKEAQEIVKEIIRRLLDPQLVKQSIGVIAFSRVQQFLIEDLLWEEFEKKPQLEELAYNRNEPLFIKNLENVQGDERDIILFSIGYGPDKNGNVSMNFGPLNQNGGERRLNVAVTRARYEMIIFSTMKPEQINTQKSSALGVIGLQKFLEFAQTQQIALPLSQIEKRVELMAEQIADQLKKYGYESELNVGKSKFKIDLAIKNKVDKNLFILGILCDGPRYFETKTMRDREIVQPNILGLLGWNCMRVWTMDWLQHPDMVIDSIITKLHQLENEKPETIPVQVEPTVVPLQEEEREEDVIPYIVADLGEDKIDFYDSFFNIGYDVKEKLLQLIAFEQPITQSLILKRMAQISLNGKVIPRIGKVVDMALDEMEVIFQTDMQGQKCYWINNDAVKEFTYYRNNSFRDIQDIPTIEIENCLLSIVKQHISIDLSSIKQLASKRLGFARCGNNIDATIETVLSNMTKKGILKMDTNTLQISKL